MEYDFKKIEKKWQKKWEKEKIYEVKENPQKDKFYCLIEFPYPSGEGLHVGHPRSYTALDIVARKNRMQGKNVLYPIGWDAFGLPTENYAIKTGIQPAVATEKNIKNFTRQLKSLGFSFDWSREINTSDPKYYKWTQWMFLQFFKHGLAYKDKIAINWCTKCKIGLANEEVVNGVCERCGGTVVKKMKEQWMIKITKYAERLLQGLEKVDYSPRIKEGQINWIGKSEGATVRFNVIPAEAGIQKTGSPIRSGMTVLEVFTTRPDTLFGATYMVLAPEHEMVGKLKLQITNWNEVEKYIGEAKRKSDLERTELQKEKTGVELKGIKAINPANNEEIPIWVADYVLTGYGTGAIMAVPAHDERDFEFAKKFGLPIKKVVQPGVRRILDLNYSDIRDIKKVVEKHKIYGVGLIQNDGNYEIIAPDEFIIVESLKEMGQKLGGSVSDDRLNFSEDKVFSGYGININSEFLNGLATPEAKEKITKWLEEKHIGKKAVNYKLRDWVFSRQRYWGEPIPLVYCENCAKKKQKILLIHGLTGRADKNWMPWMKQELEKIGFEVFAPTMTTTEHPVLERWMEELLPIVEKFGEDDIIVGHSLGGKATLHLMERLNKKINNIFLVAPAVGKITAEELAFKKARRPEKDYNTAKIFWEKDLDWEKIKKNVGNATIIYSGNDQSVRLYDHDFWPHNWFIEHVGNYNHFTDKEYPVLFDIIKTSRLTGWVPVEEKDLPVELPKVKKYEPTDTGESPLAAIEKWVKTKCPKCGGAARRETDTMPNWAGSSWYFMRYTDPKNKKEFASEKNLKYWMRACPAGQNKCNEIGGVDWYNGGMEHTTLHLLYSRFWYKFLYDIGAVPKECGDEPYKKRTSHGLILGEGGEKMSKSRGNVVNPDDIVARFGADTLRVYEMFMGPFEQAIPWDEKGVVGVFRFLERVWKLQDKLKVAVESSKLERLLHQTIKKVEEDIEQMKFNTAVSALMILTNEMAAEEKLSITSYQLLITLLAPFAPHLAEELWEKLGNKKSVHLAEWPKYDPALIIEEEIDLIVQINGKMRDSIKVKADISEEEAKKVAVESEKIKKWIERQKIKKIIFVKGKLVNIVV